MIDSVAQMIRDCTRYGRPTNARTRECLTRWRTAGDEAAWHEAIGSNLPLVISVARRFMGRGLELADLVQIGAIGLILALAKFDMGYGTQFSTYATWWIQQTIRRGLLANGLIRVPCQWHQGTSRMSAEQLAAYQQLVRVERLDASDPRDNRETFWNSRHREPVCRGPLPLEQLEKREQLLRLHLGLDRLSEREQAILQRRAHGETLDEIGRTLGLSKERIRQLEAEALYKLARALGQARPAGSLSGSPRPCREPLTSFAELAEQELEECA